MTPYKTITLADIIAKIDILTNAVLSNKQTLSIEEAAIYTGLSVSYLYKLTSTQQIPHFKPRGKMNYFDRSELDEWLRQNRVKTTAEIETAASDHLTSVGGQ
jgi:excisionase family DNA binding protein